MNILMANGSIAPQRSIVPLSKVDLNMPHEEIGFTSYQGDPDVWMRECTKDDGSDCWEYFLLYTDDCLVISPRGRGEKNSAKK